MLFRALLSGLSEAGFLQVIFILVPVPFWIRRATRDLDIRGNSMPYATGEMPIVGDRIKDKQGRQAKVTDVEGARILIRWDEGVVSLEYPCDSFVLIARRDQSTKEHNKTELSQG